MAVWIVYRMIDAVRQDTEVVSVHTTEAGAEASMNEEIASAIEDGDQVYGYEPPDADEAEWDVDFGIWGPLDVTK